MSKSRTDSELSMYRDAVDVVLDQEVPQSIVPSRAIALGLHISENWHPMVLVIGGKLPEHDFVELNRRECRLDIVVKLAEGMQALHERSYDIIVSHPNVEDEADGIRFLKALKFTDYNGPDKTVRFVADRYSAIPFLILPVAGTAEYAVFLSSDENARD